MDSFDALLQIKIRIPALRQGLVPRGRLLEQLGMGLTNRLILISAPAGYGKTTLLREWIANQSSDVKFAWLALDEGDNNPAIFLQYVIAALQRVDADIGQSLLSALQSPNPPDPVGFLPPLLNQINQRKDKVVLILDDYHLITKQPVHRITEQFIDGCSEGLCVVIASRADPPLPVYRYRARGELTEIRQAQLSFTLNETREYLLQTVGGVIHQEDIEFLFKRTEGWAVGLVLAGLSIQEGHEISESIASLSGNQVYIMEYLVNEVFERLPERIRIFLLKTSILKRLTGSLCDCITGFRDGHQILEWLKAKNLFVSALDDEQIWYRYHQLFTDLLRRRLERDSKNVLPQLHKSASDWYAQNSYLIEAIDHAMASGDYRYAIPFIEASADKLWARGEQVLLLERLESLPSEIIHSSVPLCLWYSIFKFFAGKYEEAGNYLGIAENLLLDDPPMKDRYQKAVMGTKALQDAQLALYELDTDRVVELAQHSLALLPEENHVLRQVAKIILADSLAYRGDTVEGQQAYNELLALNTIQQNPYVSFSIAIRSVFNNFSRGKLHQAYDFCQQQLHQLCALRPRLSDFIEANFEANFRVASGEILVEWNRLEEARSHFDQAYEIFEIASGKSVEALYLRMVRGYLACNEISRAKQIVGLVEDAVILAQIPRPNLGAVLARKASLCLIEGNISLAEKVLAELGTVDCTRLLYQNEAAYLMIIRVWLLQGRFQPAIVLLEALQTKLQEGGRTNRLIEALVLRAKVETIQKHPQAARGYLRQAISLAEAEGFIRVFVEEGAVICNLLEEMISAGEGSLYIHQLIAAFGSTPEPRHADRKLIDLIEPLSARERQVLPLLQTHLSQQEMADELCVSVNTIRFHTKNIYRKLGAHERSEAVAKAKSVGLL